MPNIITTATADDLTEKGLPLAIGKLLELNNYSVEYGVGIHGAEVDIIATPKSNPFQSKMYIEATVQYVDVAKYGKDLTKFSLIREVDANSICISVSAKGFTQDVRERAEKTRIFTETYDELFRRFEQFSPYIARILEDKDTHRLTQAYERPRLAAAAGNDDAIQWFDEWRNEGRAFNWVVLLGEYGTGKTALTVYLQRRWLSEYRNNPSSRIPIRIELRNFTRQFDSNSLLHHFLDNNGLSYIPLDYLRHLIRSGRIILLLDGYDEMAQFMNARERRACLSALADLANSGAIGILTSRPNYFTDAEELNVFDALYSSIEKSHYYSGKSDLEAIAEEKQVDYLLEHYVLNRKERYLRDLDEEQTKSLVEKKLSNDIEGQRVVLEILSRVFRSESSGYQQSLSGKPVIISFLLELIDELKGDNSHAGGERLTEWLTYKMIVDRLMLRDLRRSPNVHPNNRRDALRRLALLLSTRNVPAAREDDFYTIIDDVFRNELRRYQGEERRSRRDELFQDIRSSATLTRKENRETQGDAWIFSHNSIREYLVAESIVSSLKNGTPFKTSVSVSDAMRKFVSSMDDEQLKEIYDRLKAYWRDREQNAASTYLSLLWDAITDGRVGIINKLSQVFGEGGKNIDLSNLELNRIAISSEVQEHDSAFMNFESSELSAIELSNLKLAGSSFCGATLDSVSFKDCDLSDVSFDGALLFECIFIRTSFKNANFRNIDETSNFSVQLPNGIIAVHAGSAAVGYLSFCGALTDEVAPYYILMHHPKFPIVRKICDNISEQKNSQLRGLTQRGAAQADPLFSRDFIAFLSGKGIVEINQNDLVSATREGRGEIIRFLNHNEPFDGLYDFVMHY